MGFKVVTGLHTFALFIHYFLNVLCLVAVHWRIKDKPYDHWRDQYTRESRIITAVSTLYSFKATRLLYSEFLRKPYFDAACDNRFRQIIRPFFIVTMVSVLQTATVVIANVNTLWLLDWGYELVTLAISSMFMAIVIIALEVYEFVLYKRHEPDYLGVGAYFSKQMDPADRKNMADKARQRKSMKKS